MNSNIQTLTKKQLLALERPRGTTHFRASGGELKKPLVANVSELDTLDGVACAVEFGKATVTKGVIGAFTPLGTGNGIAAPAPAKPAKPAKPAPAPKAPAKPVKGKVAKPTAKPAAPAKAPKKPAAKRTVAEQPELPAMPSAAPVPPPVPAARRKPIGRTVAGATFSGISNTEMNRVAAIVVEAGQVDTATAPALSADAGVLAGVSADAVKNRLRHSIIPNPVAYAWDFFDKNRGMRRKDIIATLVTHGLAFYTARSQYQMWRAAGKADEAAKAAKK